MKPQQKFYWPDKRPQRRQHWASSGGTTTTSVKLISTAPQKAKPFCHIKTVALHSNNSSQFSEAQLKKVSLSIRPRRLFPMTKFGWIGWALRESLQNFAVLCNSKKYFSSSAFSKVAMIHTRHRIYVSL